MVDIKALSRDQAKGIYMRDFWLAVHADSMPPALAFQALDFAVHSGIGTAIRKLQVAAGVPDDGHWGPITQAKVAVINPAVLTFLFLADDQKVVLQGLLTQQAIATIAAETAAVQAVNATMVAEFAAQHWPTYTWRPFLGFIAGILLLGDYLVFPLLIPVPAVTESAWLLLAGILGVASWYCGKSQLGSTADTNKRG